MDATPTVLEFLGETHAIADGVADVEEVVVIKVRIEHEVQEPLG